MDKLLLTKCLRCTGAVIYDKFYGPHEQFWGWKCLTCGEIVDPVILENQQLMQAGQGVTSEGQGGKKAVGRRRY